MKRSAFFLPFLILLLISSCGFVDPFKQIAGTYTGELITFMHIYIGTFPDSNGVMKDLYQDADTTFVCTMTLADRDTIIHGSGCQIEQFSIKYSRNTEVYYPNGTTVFEPYERDTYEVTVRNDSLVILVDQIAPGLEVYHLFKGSKDD